MKGRKIRNRLRAFFFAFVVLCTSATVAQKAEATVAYDANELKVVYVAYTKDNADTNYTVATAYKLSAAHQAPEYIKESKVVENYLFGGWFKEIPDSTLDSEEYRAKDRQVSIKNTEEIKDLDTVYAKFVPAYVLSMKAQNDEDAEAQRTSIRLVSSVDSLEYAKVGYTVYVNNRDNQCIQNKSTYVYETLTVGTEGASDYVNYLPSQVFGSASRYFITWNYTNIPEKGYSKQIYVQPYWVTWDGTKVIGLSKYLHIDDGRYGYINIPINLRSSDEDVVAAYMSLDYSAIANKYDFMDVETGRVFHEVKTDESGNKVRNDDFGEIDSEISVTARGQSLVNIVINNTDVTEDRSAFDLYACVRFKKKDGIAASDEIVIGDNNLITFEVKNEMVSGSDEETNTNFSVWPVLY